MIAYLEGKFTYKSPAQVFLDVHGVGYEVNISLHTYSAIQDKQEGRLYTHLQVKEDSHTLFGFFEKGEKEIFLQLISVSGIGAATARMMLSSMKPDEISVAISQGNVRQIESVKGIGKKTAERLIVELRDKVGKHSGAAVNPVSVNNTLAQDAFYALTALGISKVQAEQAVTKVLKTEPLIEKLEDLIKKALKAI
jgi:Holliday junction DNA helicase RuvA